MIILLYGPDSYRRQRKLNKIVEEYKQKHSGMSLENFDLEEEGEFERLKDFAGQMSIFDTKKLAVLKNISEADSDKIKEFLKNYLNSENLTILISENSVPDEFENLLKKAFLTEKFDELNAEKLKFFAQKEIQNRGVLISDPALNLLVRNFKGDTWGFMNELEKLILWRAGNKTEISASDVKNMGDYSYEAPNIFDFINSIARNSSPSQKIVNLEKLLLGQEEPAKVFNFMAASRYLSRDLVKKLADCDVLVKSGKFDYEDVFLDLALDS
ncbi:MAG: hypothetical protein WC461_01100 [Candidatus Paceibacterota bacterium]